MLKVPHTFLRRTGLALIQFSLKSIDFKVKKALGQFPHNLNNPTLIFFLCLTPKIIHSTD